MEYIEQKPIEKKPHAKRNKILIIVFSVLAIVLGTGLGYYFMISRVFLNFRDLPYLKYTTTDGMDGEESFARIDLNEKYEDGVNLYPKKLHIPSKIEGYPVREIADEVFMDHNELEEVYIPNTVKKIGRNVFNGCTNLAKIHISKGLESIGIGAFDNTEWLENQYEIPSESNLMVINNILYSYKGEIPGGSVIVGAEESKLKPEGEGEIIELYKYKFKAYAGGVFQHQNGLIGAEFPIEAEIVEYQMFLGCENLKTVSFLGDKIKKISEEAFMDCIGLENFEFENSLVEIGKNSFANSGLTGEVSLANCNNIQNIEESAFEGCANIEKFSLPYGIDKISDYTFKDCSSLAEVVFPEQEYSEKSKIKTISNSAFSGTALKTIKIPHSVLTIESKAFANCKSLESIELYNNTTASKGVDGNYQGLRAFKGSKTFYGDENFKAINIVDKDGIRRKNGLDVAYREENISFPVTLKELGASDSAELFRGTAVKAIDFEQRFNEIILPNVEVKEGKEHPDLKFKDTNGITTISGSIFEGVTSLERVHLPDIIEETNNETDKEMKKFNDHNQIISIKSNAFKNCSELKYISPSYTSEDCVISESVKSFGSGVFTGCKNITKIHVSSNITTYTQSLFNGSGLTEIEIGSKVQEINISAFENCASLEKVTFKVDEDGQTAIQTINERAFKGCTSLKTFDMPNSVTQANNESFMGCESLESIRLSNKLSIISQSMFEGCSSLKEITIPESITEIGSNAFKGCKSLSTITFDNPRNIKTFESNALTGCEGLKTIIFNCGEGEFEKPGWIPEGVEVQYQK